MNRRALRVAHALMSGFLFGFGTLAAHAQVAGTRNAAPTPGGIAEAGVRAGVPAASLRVAIDIGHTPGAPGARSARGRYEYYFNKELSEKLQEALRVGGFPDSFLINPDGREITLPERAQVANERKADLFLAIHHDSVHDSLLRPWNHNGQRERFCDAHSGYGIFCSARNPHAGESRRFAESLGEQMRATGLRPSPHHTAKLPGEAKVLLNPERGIYEFTNLIVLKLASMPAVLLECGVIVNRDDELEIATPVYQQKIVNATVRAVREFARNRPPPAPVAESSPPPGEPRPPVDSTAAGSSLPAADLAKPAPAGFSTRRPAPAPNPSPLPPVEPISRAVVPERSLPKPPVPLPAPTPAPQPPGARN